MKRLLFLTSLLLTETCAFGQLNRPQLGMMLDANGGARAMFGLPGSLTVSDPAMTGVVSLGCASICLMKTDSSLVMRGQTPGQTVDAPAGVALFAFDSTGAFVYFSATKQLVRWQSGALTPVSFHVTGEILSIRSVHGSPEFAVRMDDEIRVVRDDDVVIYTFPRGARAVMLLGDGVLFSTGDEIVLRRSDASDLTFSLSGATAFWAMAPDYVEIRAAGAIYGLRITPGREQIFQVPEPGQ